MKNTGRNLHWHRAPDSEVFDRRGVRTPKWYAEAAIGVDPITGRHGRLIRVAEAVMTGRSGVDNYPWDWHLTDDGVERAYAMLPAESTRKLETSGVQDTLTRIKQTVSDLLNGPG